MKATGTNDSTLVVAAQAGDRRALDDLVTAHLPLVYTIVRRALSGDPDADDVVQETMLRVLRELRGLRTPESFRTWLAAIAVRQVSTHLHRRRLAAQRTTGLDDLAAVPDADAAFENLTMLELELSSQRRQLVRAGQWLDPDDRALLSLWWLEIAGEMTRVELATAIGVSVAHAGVRVQRMRGQLEGARSLVVALDARARCGQLDAVLTGWNGRPDPLWRKRIGRHTRSCAVCARADDGMVATERLLVGFALLPVPLALTAALIGKGAAATVVGATAASISGGLGAGGVSGGLGAGAKAGLITQLLQAVAAHPVIAAVVAGTVVAGAAVTSVNWPAPAPPAPTVIVAPTSTPVAPRPTRAFPDPPLPTSARTPTTSPGPRSLSLESVNGAGLYISTVDTYGVLAPVATGSAPQLRRQATLEVVAGLADANCFSFRLPDGRYLRHLLWRLRANAYDGTALFRGDATFCARVGSEAGSVSFESSNYPGWFLRHRGNELWVDYSDGTDAFRADSSFHVRPALGG